MPQKNSADTRLRHRVVGKQKPAIIIKEMFGVRPLARTLGVTPAVIVRWEDHIPVRYQRRIMELCEDAGVKFTERDMIWGRD
jgi:hypothetical protein